MFRISEIVKLEGIDQTLEVNIDVNQCSISEESISAPYQITLAGDAGLKVKDGVTVFPLSQELKDILEKELAKAIDKILFPEEPIETKPDEKISAEDAEDYGLSPE